MGFSIDTKCIVRGERKHLNRLNDFLNSIKNEDDRITFDELCNHIPIYDTELPTSDIQAFLNMNEITEINGEDVLLFWVSGWKGSYLGYIKQLIKDKELGLYDKDSEDRSVLELFYLSFIESSDYYITNDENGEFFTGKYYVSFEGEEEFLDTEEQLVDWLKEQMSNFEMDVPDTDELDDIINILNDVDYSLTIVDIKLEQELDDW